MIGFKPEFIDHYIKLKMFWQRLRNTPVLSPHQCYFQLHYNKFMVKANLVTKTDDFLETKPKFYYLEILNEYSKYVNITFNLL